MNLPESLLIAILLMFESNNMSSQAYVASSLFVWNLLFLVALALWKGNIWFLSNITLQMVLFLFFLLLFCTLSEACIVPDREVLVVLYKSNGGNLSFFRIFVRLQQVFYSLWLSVKLSFIEFGNLWIWVSLNSRPLSLPYVPFLAAAINLTVGVFWIKLLLSFRLSLSLSCFMEISGSRMFSLFWYRFYDPFEYWVYWRNYFFD